MDTKHNYEVNLKWKNQRLGSLSSPVLNESVEVATPPEFPQGMPGIWSPEHLFVASVSSCLMTTFLAIAENSRLEYQDLEIKANGTLEKSEGKFMITAIELRPVLTIADEKFADKAERILHKAEAACLISNSVKTKVTLKPEVLLAETA